MASATARKPARRNATRRTVLVAGTANVVVALAKLAAGLLSGSSAVLAEAAHSVADTLNQAFLLTSLHQGDRPADERHPRELELIRAEIEQTPGIDALLDLLTMHLGPDHLIIAARVDLSEDISAGQVEDLAEDIDRRLAEKLPQVPHVFIDPTPADRRGSSPERTGWSAEADADVAPSRKGSPLCSG